MEEESQEESSDLEFDDEVFSSLIEQTEESESLRRPTVELTRSSTIKSPELSLNKFEIIGKLGTGAYGKVHKAVMIETE